MTAFTRTWDASYMAQPADNENASLGATRIRNMRTDIKERMAVDHSWAGDADDGAHTVITFIEHGSDPAAVANRGFFYTKDIAGITELFYRDSAGNIIQLTSDGVINATGITVAMGGTGRASLTAHDLLIGNDASPVSFLAPGAAGHLVTSDGTDWTSAAPPTVPSGLQILTAAFKYDGTTDTLLKGTAGLSVTKNTTGDYTINVPAFSDAHWCYAFGNGLGAGAVGTTIEVYSQTTTAIRVKTLWHTNAGPVHASPGVDCVISGMFSGT